MNIIRMMILILILILCPPLYADDSRLITDMESLRDSLPFKDPGRPTLTRRLADLYFQKVIVDDKNLILTGKGNAAEIAKQRSRAIKLYQEALDGERGNYPAATGELKYKIQFQMARLDRMEGRKAQSLRAFKNIAETPSIGKSLLKETLLTIAEMEDENGKWQEAQLAYEKALPLCQGPDAIGYVRYRLAWAYFRKGDVVRAQEEIAQTLFDAQGNLKDQSAADYIQFLAATPNTDGKASLEKIEALSHKVQRPGLVEDLANAYFAAGNREAGVTALSHSYRLSPTPFSAARLAEEYYGFRRLDDMTAMLRSLLTQAEKVAVLEDKPRKAMDQILRRLVVQLDGERKSNPGQFQTEVMMAIDVYLALYPQSEITEKMREGWLSANTNEQEKITRLSDWIKTTNDAEKIKKYRLNRASLALKTTNNALVREDALELAKNSNESTHREWTYIEAKAALDSGDQAHALEVFKTLASKTNNPDKWAIQSQHLALDILNREKRFAELAAQAAVWTNSKELKNSAAKNDVAEMEKARQEALFENAASLGESQEALAQFLQFCEQGLFVEKSCPNAKVLAVKLGQQLALVKVLEIQKDEEALAAEYERMGRFAEAAKFNERKLKATDDEMAWIKVALLYQIEGDEVARSRVLKTLATRLQKQGKMTEKTEAVVWASYQGANLNNADLLRIPWSTSHKLQLAAYLQRSGKGDATTLKLVRNAENDLGSVWAKEVFNRVEALNLNQKKMHFYGSNSRANFQRRLTLIGKYASEVKSVLNGASTPVRVQLLSDLAAAYSELDQEILNTPLPAGLDEAQIAQAKEAMESLAAPIREEGMSFQKLQEEQLATLTNAEEWRAIVKQGKDAVIAQIQREEITRAPSSSPVMTEVERTQVLSQLEKNPNDRVSLERLRDEYNNRGDVAAAAYFNGRLNEMENI